MQVGTGAAAGEASAAGSVAGAAGEGGGVTWCTGDPQDQGRGSDHS